MVGPGWQGPTAAGIEQTFRAETDFILAIYRTQLFDPAEIDNVRAIQSRYKVQTLSEFLGTTAPPDSAAVDWIEPLTEAEQKTSLEFFDILNFVLAYCPTDHTEVELRKRFARIGVEPAGNSIRTNCRLS